ncbi:hypothetical protein L6164_028288 [Bauhinia variegata]|uniref:Uncharacterized protein n=1 Tax=Bauhinia variegata TaxID=167791 RepID=A0ACB9LX92_BAUVA|nr:hypothetical protein L6164_028288 [Bauhinia variegata]
MPQQVMAKNLKMNRRRFSFRIFRKWCRYILAAASTVVSTFILVFVAEWGDKSFFSTIASCTGRLLIGDFLSEKIIYCLHRMCSLSRLCCGNNVRNLELEIRQLKNCCYMKS